MKKSVQVISIIVLSLLMCLTSFAKEEVIYVNLDTLGNVEDITAVNILTPNSNGEILDYGKYTGIRNMTTLDELFYDGEKISGKVSTDKIYVEGKTLKTDIPWKVYIFYYLDGQYIYPEDLIGKSGKLEIYMFFRGTGTDKTFYDNYTLQITATLDTDICKNIIAEDATIANVGSNKQLSYVVLPKVDKDILISADVTNFEMDPITINAVNMNMGLDAHEMDLEGYNKDYDDLMNDLDDMDEALDDMLEGSLDLMDGANDLSKGIHKTYNGWKDFIDYLEGMTHIPLSETEEVKTLLKAMRKLDNGAEDLYYGTEEFRDGIVEFYDKIKDIEGDTKPKDKVKDKMNEILDDAFGKNFVPVSFIDDRNQDVDSVLFVMKTPKLELPEVEQEELIEVQQTFWEKLIGLYKDIFS